MSQAEGSEPANRVEKIRNHLRDDNANSAQESVGAAQPPSDLTLANITCDQVRDVNIMVDYAVRRGLDVPPDVLQDIAQAKKQLIEGQVIRRSLCRGKCETRSRHLSGHYKKHQL